MNNLKNDIKCFMSEKRYEHTLAVQRECIRLAEIFGLDAGETSELKIAALLHDITKELPESEQLKLCKHFCISPEEIDLYSPKLFHAVTGANLAREKYPDIVTDKVYNAILSHTVGSRNMTLFDKLLYLADYIEDTRCIDDCVALRRYFYDGLGKGDNLAHLDRTLLLSFDMTIGAICGGDEYLCPKTVVARNDLLLRMKGLIV